LQLGQVSCGPQEAAEHPKTWFWYADMARLWKETQGWGFAALSENVMLFVV